MNVDPGELRSRMAVLRGKIAGGTAHGNDDVVADARRQLTLLKTQRLLEVTVDLLRQVEEGHDVSVERTLNMTRRALDAIEEVNRD